MQHIALRLLHESVGQVCKCSSDQTYLDVDTEVVRVGQIGNGVAREAEAVRIFRLVGVAVATQARG